MSMSIIVYVAYLLTMQSLSKYNVQDPIWCQNVCALSNVNGEHSGNEFSWTTEQEMDQ